MYVYWLVIKHDLNVIFEILRCDAYDMSALDMTYRIWILEMERSMRNVTFVDQTELETWMSHDWDPFNDGIDVMHNGTIILTRFLGRR